MRRCAWLAAIAVLLPDLVAAQAIDICPSVRADSRVKASDPEFIVNPLGNVLANPRRAVTEEDAVLVRVLTTDARAQRLTVRRKSPARTVGNVRVIGLPEPETMVLGGARTPPAKEACYLDVRLSDFAPGLGQAEIQLDTLKDNEVQRLPVGTFEFNVEPVYAGMVSLGPIVTDLLDPKFEVATNSAGKTYIAESESGSDRVVYAMVYTPFVAGKRVAQPPLSMEPRSWLRRINPMFGIVLSDISRNALAGISVDLPFGIIAHGGWHMGRTSEIDAASGLGVGSEISSDATIPVIRKWNTARFLGVTLDMRVAGRLLGLASKTTVP